MREVGKKEEESGFRINITEYLRVLWRKRLLVAVPLILSTGVAMFGVRFLVPIYMSGVVFRIEDKSVMSREMERLVETGPPSRQHDSEIKARLESDLKSSAFLDALARKLGFQHDPELVARAQRAQQNIGRQVTVEELVLRHVRSMLRKRIEVKRDGPSLFSVSYYGPDPDACYVIANTMSDLYVEQQRSRQISSLREVSDFSVEQLALAKERLEKSERELENFQERMAEASSARNPVDEKNIGTAETLQRQLQTSVQDGQSVVDGIRSRLNSVFGSVPSSDKVWNDSDLKRLENQLTSQMETMLIEQVRGGGVASSPAAQQDINQTHRELQGQLAQVVSRAYPDVSRDYVPLIVEYFYQLTELRARSETLQKLKTYVESYRKQIALAPQMQTELERLKGQVESNRTLYESFLRAKTTTQISEAAQNTQLGSTVAVVEDAQYPLLPVRPNKIKILVLAILFGLTVGGGGLLLSEMSDTSFRTIEDVERRLGLRVLGTIPKEDAAGKWKRQRTARRTVAWVAGSVVVAAVGLAGFYYVGKMSKQEVAALTTTESTTQTEQENGQKQPTQPEKPQQQGERPAKEN